MWEVGPVATELFKTLRFQREITLVLTELESSELVLKHLTLKRSIDASRMEFFSYAEAFPSIVQMEFVVGTSDQELFSPSFNFFASKRPDVQQRALKAITNQVTPVARGDENSPHGNSACQEAPESQTSMAFLPGEPASQLEQVPVSQQQQAATSNMTAMTSWKRITQLTGGNTQTHDTTNKTKDKAANQRTKCYGLHKAYRSMKRQHIKCAA
ncbi:hypothetical protein SELMODRAFT_431647 [Selaginella moellendorffii]|uniref:Uncharacterized protein n=1 Tax=Selaginella moellendorffii TaxID=88036 RepID=D8TDC1_SELML|nr:hypothetical protein SELMODRAFT_431647 [Selaginella moellendorffii]